MGDSGVTVTQVVEARVCPRFEDLVPLTEEGADALTDIQAGERIQAIGIHCKMLVEKARTVVLRFLPEIRSIRKRYSQPGRRNTVPGLPTWGKVRSTCFPFSDSHMRRLLADPEEEQPEPETRPAAEDAVDVEVKDDPQPEAQAPVAEGVAKDHPQIEAAPFDVEAQEQETPRD